MTFLRTELLLKWAEWGDYGLQFALYMYIKGSLKEKSVIKGKKES